MITLIILSILLFLQVAIAIYNYTSIEVDTSHGSKKGDISKNLTLASLVLSAVFFIFIMTLYFIKFIDYSRAEFLLIVSVLTVGIIMILCYHYLDLQYKSLPGYQAAVDNLKDNTIRDNVTQMDLALSAGVIGLSVGLIIVLLLFGKYYLSEQKIIKIKEPIYMNMQTTSLKEDYKEPDYMSEVSKNFIV